MDALDKSSFLLSFSCCSHPQICLNCLSDIRSALHLHTCVCAAPVPASGPCLHLVTELPMLTARACCTTASVMIASMAIAMQLLVVLPCHVRNTSADFGSCRDRSHTDSYSGRIDTVVACTAAVSTITLSFDNVNSVHVDSRPVFQQQDQDRKSKCSQQPQVLSRAHHRLCLCLSLCAFVATCLR